MDAGSIPSRPGQSSSIVCCVTAQEPHKRKRTLRSVHIRSDQLSDSGRVGFNFRVKKKNLVEGIPYSFLDRSIDRSSCNLSSLSCALLTARYAMSDVHCSLSASYSRYTPQTIPVMLVTCTAILIWRRLGLELKLKLNSNSNANLRRWSKSVDRHFS